MLHELLLALSGFHGDIFVKRDGKIKVANDLQFLHPTEENLLNRICKLATNYVILVDFIKANGHLPGNEKGPGLHGLYVRAFCQGLDQVLEPYRQKLVHLEQELLADPHLTLSYIQSCLDEYQDLFPVLTAIVQQLQTRKVHGCNILEVLHKEAASVTAKAKAALLRIHHVCHGVLYRQLAGWMLHGLLLDKYGEFFVQIAPTKSDSGDEKTDDADDENDLGLIGGLTGKQLKKVLELAGHSTDLSKQERFTLKSEMLPSYLPLRVAEKILFVGESVQIFESERGKSQQRHKESILKEKEDEFSKDLHHLSQEAIFNLMNFEDTIDKIRAYVSERLWKLVVEDADLLSQLRIMKDFFLLGRGELFLAFIDKAQPMLRIPATGSTQHDVNSAFIQAAHNVFFDDEKLLQKLTFIVPYTHKSKDKEKSPEKKGSRKASASADREQPSTENGWNSLSLTYKVEWPIHIMVTPTVIDRYNILFKFLLLVKRVETELQQCWALQMQRKQTIQGQIATGVWWLRNSMAFLINNLQYYLQVDVIESQFTILQDKINGTRDFETIRHAHDTFISSLLSQSFLLMKPVSHCLHEILELCHQFHNVMLHSEIHLTDRELSELERIAKDFQRQSNLLFKILSSVRSHQSSPHLAQLLLRLDYNKYFTQAGGQLGSFAPVRMAPHERLPSSSRR